MKKFKVNSAEVPLSRGFASVLATLVMAGAMFGAPAVSPDTVAEVEAPVVLGNAEEEILWLARALYSESKVESEQVLVAWVIRNRVESEKYPDTYKNVVLAPRQFSGLHSTDEQYSINVSMNYSSQGRGWQTALAVAESVYNSEGMLRPIGSNVYHFYSPSAVSKTPSWAVGEKPEHTVYDIEKGYTRFAFYADIK